MYLIPITISLCITYFIFIFLFGFFFDNKLAKIPKRFFISLVLIFVVSLAGYVIVSNIPDPWWANRIQHGFGGGFVAFLVCFLVVKDTKLDIGKFRFFIFSILLVTALGVGNEIMEFFLQNYAGVITSATINDTGLDLISNTVGSLIAAITLTPFLNNKRD